MHKREEFAVSLRKKRTKAIIQEKRLKRQLNNNTAQLNFIPGAHKSGTIEHTSVEYDGFETILKDKDQFEKYLLEIAP